MPSLQRQPSESSIDGVDLVDRLLCDATEAGVSDVHLDPTEDSVDVRWRRDGALERRPALPARCGPRVVGRLKSLADLLVYRTDVPQEGRIASARSPAGRELRVATYPTPFGERVALRLHTDEAAGHGLEDLGLTDATRTALADALAQPDGVLLITGPSGSGKTTTLYGAVEHLGVAAPNRAIVTVEDPIERRVRGVTQTEIHRSSGLDFARALRSLLRQDPDTLLIGEIRDRETAHIAFEAGLTGHLVLSSVHAGTAPRVFARLLDMGVEPFSLTSVLRGVLAQRLLRRRCPNIESTDCGEACGSCRGSGYAGRTLVAEWLPMGPALRRAVLARRDAEALTEAARTAGHRSLFDEARAQVHAGITTDEEVRRVLGTD